MARLLKSDVGTLPPCNLAGHRRAREPLARTRPAFERRGVRGGSLRPPGQNVAQALRNVMFSLPVGPTCLLLAILAAVSGATNATAQVARGRLVGPPHFEGVGGAMMTLIDREGRGLASTLTRASGLFELESPSPGRYLVGPRRRRAALRPVPRHALLPVAPRPGPRAWIDRPRLRTGARTPPPGDHGNALARSRERRAEVAGLSLREPRASRPAELRRQRQDRVQVDAHPAATPSTSPIPIWISSAFARAPSRWRWWMEHAPRPRSTL